MATQFGFEVIRMTNELNVRFWTVAPQFGGREVATVSWFVSDGEWTSPGLEFTRMSGSDNMEAAHNLLTRLMKGVPNFRYTSPADFFEVIGKMRGVMRVVRDRRMGGIVPIEDVLAPEIVVYFDDYEAAGNVVWEMRAFTTTPEEAQAFMIVNWPTNKSEEKARWIAAGLPVKCDPYCDAPNADQLRSVDEMIAL